MLCKFQQIEKRKYLSVTKVKNLKSLVLPIVSALFCSFYPDLAVCPFHPQYILILKWRCNMKNASTF